MSWFPVGLAGAFQVAPPSVLRTMAPAAPIATTAVAEMKVTSSRFSLGSPVTDRVTQVWPLSVLCTMVDVPPPCCPTVTTVDPLK